MPLINRSPFQAGIFAHLGSSCHQLVVLKLAWRWTGAGESLALEAVPQPIQPFQSPNAALPPDFDPTYLAFQWYIAQQEQCQRSRYQLHGTISLTDGQGTRTERFNRFSFHSRAPLLLKGQVGKSALPIRASGKICLALKGFYANPLFIETAIPNVRVVAGEMGRAQALKITWNTLGVDLDNDIFFMTGLGLLPFSEEANTPAMVYVDSE